MSRADEMKEIDDVFNTHSIEVERTHDCYSADDSHACECANLAGVAS